jgi:hypothetical protein
LGGTALLEGPLSMTMLQALSLFLMPVARMVIGLGFLWFTRQDHRRTPAE